MNLIFSCTLIFVLKSDFCPCFLPLLFSFFPECEKHQDRDDFASSGASDTESDVEAFVDMNVQLRKAKEKLRSKVPVRLKIYFV